ncbi:putative MFS family arabinose efflux permease [Palleronia aestuarii]|uniref:Putative MFS family arabinose efflux permease n=1 Tax=Palleronia aestuarii TaxID=568105 RepID=A0A2W7MZA9_9RHOB|nr:MFS transporter [Palleronia aestuarii]PZX09934.1 putative MFS family arabinose efflux permease [Palleronia aestuarii]
MKTFSSIAVLLVGIVLIMLGNGMQFTLMGLRGDIEGFSAPELGIITSGYFAGFLAGARYGPVLIGRVGHVRVFGALGGLMSAGLITFPLLSDPWSWTALRVLIGFCMSGVYVTAESWLNAQSTNETRGRVLSVYMICQTVGIIGAQWLLTLGDAATSVLFIGASILVSVSFAPILLSASPAPVATMSRSMSLRKLFESSPLGAIGIFLLGAIYATQSGMGAVFGTQIGMTTEAIALFVAALFAGALVFQIPIGWLSDRVDRRLVICGSAAIGAAFSAFGFLAAENRFVMLGAAVVAGGMTTPLYALLLAYTNDYLSAEDMPAASGGLVFVFGAGAILGPLATGWAMDATGPGAFWSCLGATFALIAVYALWRTTRRSSLLAEETDNYIAVVPGATPVAAQAASIWAAENAETDAADNQPSR